MSFAIQFDLRELNNVADVMQLLADADRESLARDIEGTILTQTALRFADEIDPDGNDWIPSQRVVKDGGKTLQIGKTLMESIVGEIGSNGDYIEVGSNLVYAAIHQFGGVVNDFVALDARSYLGINDDNMAEIGESVIAFYQRILH